MVGINSVACSRTMGPVAITTTSLANKCFSVLIILLPFLQQYIGLGNVVSLGEILLVPFILGFLIADGKTIGTLVNRSLLFFYLVSIGLSVIGGFPFDYFSFGEFWTLVARLVFYAGLILVARRHFTWDVVRDLYLLLVTVAALYLVIQYVYHLAGGGYLPIVISDSLVFSPEKTFDTWTDKYQWYFRPSSLFLEPSYYSLFTLPALVAFAISEKDKSLPRFVLLVVTYALSSANSGLLASIVVLILFLAFKKKTQLDYLVGSLMLLAAVLYLPFHNIDWMTAAGERLAAGGSLDNRVIRGFMCSGLLGPFHQVIGVGLNNLGSYMSYNALSTGFDSDGLNYCATWIQTLNYSGIVGFCALVFYVGSLFKQCKGRMSRALCVVLIVVMAYESILFSYRFAFMVILLEGFIRYESAAAECEAGVQQ